MSSNIVKLKVPKKMRRKANATENSDNVVELSTQNPNITPQELLAQLSRRKDITQVVVIFPEDDPNDEDVQYTHIVSARMTLAEINFMADKAKMHCMGLET